MIRLGIDLGGTKTEAVSMDTGGNLLARKRVPTPSDYTAMVKAVCGLVSEFAPDDRDIAGIGVAHPGSENPDSQMIRGANSTWLNGQTLRRDLAEALGRDVRTANDANCFALSEATDGAGAGAASVFGVILGTGVGGGLVVGGALLSGSQGIAGEWGHNPLPWMDADEYPGPECWCGRTGCIEAWLSGPGIAADRYRRTGETGIPTDILTATQEMRRYSDRLARALAQVVNIADPEVIVLGGGVSNADGLSEAVEAALPQYVFADEVKTRVRRNRYGDSSGVRGAAWLWPAR